MFFLKKPPSLKALMKLRWIEKRNVRPILERKNAEITDETKPSQADRFFFDNNGYLVLERLLEEDHVAQLLETLHRLVAQRREFQERDISHTGMTHIQGDNTRIFYILDDDPMFLEMLDCPAILPYVTGLLNERPHHHASDAIVEYGPKGRSMGWHRDGHDNGYRGLGVPHSAAAAQNWILT